MMIFVIRNNCQVQLWLFLIIFFLINNIYGIDNRKLILTNKLYDNNNINELYQLYQQYPENLIINYLHAKLLLDHNKPSYALYFVNISPDSYLKNDLIHQLLIYYYQQNNINSFNQYAILYSSLHNTQISDNETCGFDVSNLLIDHNSVIKTNIAWLTNNKLPKNCIDLSLIAYRLGKIDKLAIKQIINNLILYDNLSTYNQLALKFKLSNPIIHARSGTQNEYQLIYFIKKYSRDNINSLLKLLQNNLLSITSKQQLSNYLALQYALEQNFINANILFKFANNMNRSYNQNANTKQNINLSDTEYEWRTRTSLALMKWQEVIININSMPETIRHKDVWLYWLAKAYEHNQSVLTSIQNNHHRQIKYLKQISHNYSYYSILAQNELYLLASLNNIKSKNLNKQSHNITIMNDTDQYINDKIKIYKQQIRNHAAQYNDISYWQEKNWQSNDYNDDANYVKLLINLSAILDLYAVGVNNNCQQLIKIATFQWYYLSRILNNNGLMMMAMLANNAGYYDLSINAANKLDKYWLSLNFPNPFLITYMKYTNEWQLDNNYLLAISRQESRFNKNIVAFDGGLGLMQLMPNTVKYILQKSKYTKCDLLDSECNIMLGSWYINALYRQLGNYIYAIAGYNAGPNRAKRWQNNLNGLNNLLQIELIPINITRSYVQNVLTNKVIYDSFTNLSELNKSYPINLINPINQLTTIHANNNILYDDKTDVRKH